MRETEIAIVGGGHAGLLAACWLKALNFDVAVIDPRLGVAPVSGRTLAVLGGSQVALSETGLWHLVEPFGTAIHQVDVGDLGSDGHVRYRAEDISVDALAFGFRQFELRNALLASVASSDLLENSIQEMKLVKGGRILVGCDGTKIRASLVIAADGRGSRLRGLAKITTSTINYSQQALSFTVQHKRSHRHTVLERMSSEGPLAVLPVGERECGITWVRASDHSSASDEEMVDGLRTLIGDILGDIELTSEIDRFPLGALHAQNYVAPRLALIGDAAHGVHPIHAQGFNMAVADVAALAKVLVHARKRGEEIGGACLRRYEKMRRPDNQARLRMTDGLNRLFSNDIKPLLPVRRAILDGLTAFAPLRQRAIRHGMRLSG